MLGLLYEDAERTWTADDLRAAVDAPASSLHRELHRALEAGLVSRDDSARPHRYSANRATPLFEAIKTMLDRTVGIEAELRSGLERLEGIDAAVLHGSWAEGTASAGSDVDLMVVGSLEHDQLMRVTRALGRRLGRRIDTVLFDSDELRRRRHEGSVAKLLDGPRIDLVGRLDDLLGIR